MSNGGNKEELTLQWSSEQATDLVGALLVEMDKTFGKDNDKTLNKSQENVASSSVKLRANTAKGIPAGKPDQKQIKDGSPNKNKHSISSKHGDDKSSKRHTKTSSSSTSKEKAAAEMNSLKDELKAMRDALSQISQIVPVVKGLKSAHDAWLEDGVENPDVSCDVAQDGGTHSDDNAAHNNAKRDHILTLESDSDTEESPHKKQKNDNAKPDKTDSVSGMDLIDQIEKDVERNDSCDVPINERLAKIVNTVAQVGLSPEKEKERQKDINRPENSEMMGKVKVNHEVWHKLLQSTKNKDLYYQSLLEKINCAMIPLAKLDSTPQPSEVQKTLLDSVVLLSNVTYKLNIKRRDTIKPELKDAYKTLCSTNNPITSSLLGEDLSKAANEAKETDNVTNKMIGYAYHTQNNQYGNHRPTYRGGYQGRARG